MRTLQLVLLALLATACTSSNRPNTDSKSNWLRECSADADCGDALSCTCGVCTLACSSTSACADDTLEGKCIDPSKEAIGSSCARDPELGALKVCLQSCKGGDDCIDGQSCLAGVCIDHALTPDAMISDPPTDGSTGPVADGGPDGSVSVVDGGQQPGDSSVNCFTGPTSCCLLEPDSEACIRSTGDATVDPPDSGSGDPVVDGGLSCASEVRDCCGPGFLCPNDLVCHIDYSCIAPGADDELGIATLRTSVSESTWLLAADDQFAYGALKGEDDPDTLMRWSATDGASETLATVGALGDDGRTLLVDGDKLVFLAAPTPSDLSNSLLSMPKDGSAAPQATGTAGTLLVQDASYYYFTNDGDSRVVRLPKGSLGVPADREEIFVATTDAPFTLVSLAVNSTTLFVAEIAPQSEAGGAYTIHRVDTTTKQPTVFTDSVRLTARDPRMLANDDYLVVQGVSSGTSDRIDLATLEVKPFSGSSPYIFSGPLGDTLYVMDGEGELVRIELSTAHTTRTPVPWHHYSALVAAAQSLYAIAFDWQHHQKMSLVRLPL